MNKIILNTFISKLEFIDKMIKHPYNNDSEIKILNVKETDEITGTLSLKYKSGENEVIFFSTKLLETNNTLIFESEYHSEGRYHKEVDMFFIEHEQKEFLGQKTKLLIHFVDGNLLEVYAVGKKYNFDNGIHEGLTKLNMKNENVINLLNNNYRVQGNKKR